jgi:hypothetical protein
MLRCRVRSDAQPRSKKGQPPQSTTGLARASCPQAIARVGRAETSRSVIMSLMATTKSGAVSSALTQRRRCMSRRSGLASPPASRRSSAMPQIGQLPGASVSISACIGHVQTSRRDRAGGASSAMPQCGQGPGASLPTPGHMEQV